MARTRTATGSRLAGGDCDDHDPRRYPGRPEVVCDGIDNNCNGDADEQEGLDSNDEHCGRCDNPCTPEAACVAGECRACPPEMALVRHRPLAPHCIDRWEASRPDATESAAGVDESMATSRPEVVPWFVWGMQPACNAPTTRAGTSCMRDSAVAGRSEAARGGAGRNRDGAADRASGGRAGMGFARRRGAGGGRGRGWCRWLDSLWRNARPRPSEEVTEQEERYLSNRADLLREELNSVEQRLQDLSASRKHPQQG